jgi:hypothetical protein
MVLTALCLVFSSSQLQIWVRRTHTFVSCAFSRPPSCFQVLSTRGQQKQQGNVRLPLVIFVSFVFERALCRYRTSPKKRLFKGSKSLPSLHGNRKRYWCLDWVRFYAVHLRGDKRVDVWACAHMCISSKQCSVWHWQAGLVFRSKRVVAVSWPLVRQLHQ